ncbi:MAG: lipoprotein [Amphritea sp.]|nr:lipoprotein [Amphritea sp.]
MKKQLAAPHIGQYPCEFVGFKTIFISLARRYNRAIIVQIGKHNVKHWWIAVFFSALLLGGCGQKGPLYLPDETPTKEQNQE